MMSLRQSGDMTLHIWTGVANYIYCKVQFHKPSEVRVHDGLDCTRGPQ